MPIFDVCTWGLRDLFTYPDKVTPQNIRGKHGRLCHLGMLCYEYVGVKAVDPLLTFLCNTKVA